MSVSLEAFFRPSGRSPPRAPRPYKLDAWYRLDADACDVLYRTRGVGADGVLRTGGAVLYPDLMTDVSQNPLLSQ